MARPNPRRTSKPRVNTAGEVKGVRTAKREAPSPKLARAVQRRDATEDDQLAIELARDGDDSMLLPYQPTPSINPARPRTLAAGYDSDSKTLRVRFRDGTVYEYFNVPQRVWRNFRRVKSPGRAINRTLNYYDYARMDDL
jgi:hypothetical protein